MLLAVTEHQNLRRFSQKLELVSHQDDAFVSKGLQDSFLKDSIRDGRVNCRKRIIEKVNVSVLVESTCQANSSLLAS